MPPLPLAVPLRYPSAMPRIARFAALFAALVAVAACGSDPDKPGTPDQNRVTAKAVADVDAAMADARRAPPPVATTR